jgi:hypothetical protein
MTRPVKVQPAAGAGTCRGVRLIDPEGVAADPALERGVMMRNLKDGLADREPAEARMIMTRHCQHAGRFAGAGPEVIPTSPHSLTTICRSSRRLCGVCGDSGARLPAATREVVPD